jgi:hypothetical protein
MVDERDLPDDGTVGGAWDRPTAIERARHADRRTLRWRLVLIGLSMAGSVAAIASLLAGHGSLALRLLLATLVILGGLLLQAVL